MGNHDEYEDWPGPERELEWRAPRETDAWARKMRRRMGLPDNTLTPKQMAEVPRCSLEAPCELANPMHVAIYGNCYFGRHPLPEPENKGQES